MLKFGSFRALFSALLKFKVRFKPKLLSLRENKLDTKQCIPISNGYYYSCLTLKNASISVFSARSISSEQASSCVIEHVFPHGYPSVVWSSSSDNGVLLCTNNGKWLRFDFPADSLLPSSCVWEEDSIRSFIYCIAGSCPNCSLIVIMGKRRNLESLWELELLQLRKGHKNVTIVRTNFPFFPSDLDSTIILEAGEGLDPFCVHRVCVVPLHQSSFDSCLNEHNCTKHRLLIQFGYTIVVFELTTTDSRCSVSPPLKVWYPSYRSQDFIYSSATTCLLSKDLTIVALCKSNNMKEVNLWSIENGREYRVAIPNQSKTDSNVQSSKATKCLAVGHLFTVIAQYHSGCLPIIYIMSTEIGAVFCECDLNAVKLPLVSKITSCYLQETEQHNKLLKSLEIGPCQLWLNTVKHGGTGSQDLCVIVCLSAQDSCILTITF